MFKFLNKKQKPHIGINLTPEGIIAIVLNADNKSKQKNNRSISLKNYAYAPFHEEVIQNGQISNPEVFVNTLMKLLSEHKFDTKSANIAIPGNAAFIKTLTLPDVPYDDLRMIATQEVSKYLPFPANEANIDFEIMECTKRQINSNGNTAFRKVDVIVVALPKLTAKNIVATFSHAGLEVAAIDLAPFAMIRTLANAELISDADLIDIAILIGYENTDINIVYKGMPLFTNTIPVGKKNIIDSLVVGLNLDIEAVEKLLPEIVLVVPGMNVSLDPQLIKAASIARNIFNNISSEIEKTIEFYNSQTPNPKEVSKIIVAGSGVCIQNIDKYISNRLKINTVLCDPLKNINHNLEYSENLIFPINIPALTTSVGLSLKGFEN